MYDGLPGIGIGYFVNAIVHNMNLIDYYYLLCCSITMQQQSNHNRLYSRLVFCLDNCMSSLVLYQKLGQRGKRTLELLKSFPRGIGLYRFRFVFNELIQCDEKIFLKSCLPVPGIAIFLSHA